MALFYDKQSGIVFADMDQYWDEFNRYSQDAQVAWLSNNSQKLALANDSPLFRRRSAIKRAVTPVVAVDSKKKSTPAQQAEIKSKLVTVQDELLEKFGFIIINDETKNEKAIARDRYLERVKHESRPTDLRYINENELDSILTDYFSPRLAYLFQYYKFLLYKHKKRMAILDKLNKLTVKRAEAERKNSFFFTIVDVGKKFVDLIDDICYPILRLLPKTVIEVAGAFIMGFVGMFIHACESYNGMKQAYYAYYDKKNKHRNLYMGSGIATFAMGATGFGLSLAYGLTGVGAKILAETMFPVFITTLLLGIYTVNLGKNIYLLRQAKKKLKEKEELYNEVHSKCQNELDNLQQQLDSLRAERIQILHSNEGLAYKEKKLREIAKREMACQIQWANYIGELQVYYQSYRKAADKCYELKREIAFNSIEVLGSLLTVLSIALGVAIFMTVLGLPTLGTGPLLAITILGIVIGSSSKVFEKVDEWKEHKFSNAIANKLSTVKNTIGGWFCKLTNKLGFTEQVPIQIAPLPFSNVPVAAFPGTPVPKQPTINTKGIIKDLDIEKMEVEESSTNDAKFEVREETVSTGKLSEDLFDKDCIVTKNQNEILGSSTLTASSTKPNTEGRGSIEKQPLLGRSPELETFMNNRNRNSRNKKERKLAPIVDITLPEDSPSLQKLPGKVQRDILQSSPTFVRSK